MCATVRVHLVQVPGGDSTASSPTSTDSNTTPARPGGTSQSAQRKGKVRTGGFWQQRILSIKISRYSYNVSFAVPPMYVALIAINGFFTNANAIIKHFAQILKSNKCLYFWASKLG